MTVEEERIYSVLKVLHPTMGKRLSRNEFSAIVAPVAGSSYYHIKDRLSKLRYVEEGHFIDEQHPYLPSGTPNQITKVFLTDFGEQAYYHYRNQKRSKRITGIAFWILFVAGIISAVYAVVSYHFTDKPKNEQPSRAMKRQEQIKAFPTQSKSPDTPKR